MSREQLNPSTNEGAGKRAVVSSSPDRVQKSVPKRINWNPDLIKHYALDFFREHGELSSASLREVKNYRLLAAIVTKYPGSLYQLKQDLAINTKTSKPKNFWTPEKIEEEAKQHIHDGRLTDNLLKHNRASGLARAIHKYYPGGMNGIKEKLGLKLEQKPVGYWTPEKIKAEIVGLLSAGETISTKRLNEIGRSDLAGAINNHYPGGISKLKEDLGLKVKRFRYWTPEQTEKEADKILREKGEIGYASLRKMGRNDLANAIKKRYPGGMPALRQKIQLEKSVAKANTQIESLIKD